MPTNTSQSRQAPYSLVLGPIGGMAGTFANRAGGALATGVLRFVVPADSFSKGIVVRSIVVSGNFAASAPDGDIDVLNGLTTMLDSVLTITGFRNVELTLANNGTEIVAPGGVIIISAQEGSAGGWDSTEQLQVSVTINYDQA